MEFGTLLNAVETIDNPNYFGDILRAATPEDHLLWDRVERHRLTALDECQHMLEARSLSVTLLDAELLFDGKSIFFYYLGDVTPEVDAVTAELAQAYEAKIQLHEFAAAVEAGCGPDCGTTDNCESGGCKTCSIAGLCHPTADAASPR